MRTVFHVLDFVYRYSAYVIISRYVGTRHFKSPKVEPLFRGHPQDQGKCPLKRGWVGVC